MNFSDERVLNSGKGAGNWDESVPSTIEGAFCIFRRFPGGVEGVMNTLEDDFCIIEGAFWEMEGVPGIIGGGSGILGVGESGGEQGGSAVGLVAGEGGLDFFSKGFRREVQLGGHDSHVVVRHLMNGAADIFQYNPGDRGKVEAG